MINKNNTKQLPNNFGEFKSQTEQDYKLFKSNCIFRILGNISCIIGFSIIYCLVLYLLIPKKYNFKYGLMFGIISYLIIKYSIDIIYSLKIMYLLKLVRPNFMYVKYYKTKSRKFLFRFFYNIQIKNVNNIIYDKYFRVSYLDEYLGRTNYAVKMALFEVNKNQKKYILINMYNENGFYSKEEWEKGKIDYLFDKKINR